MTRWTPCGARFAPLLLSLLVAACGGSATQQQQQQNIPPPPTGEAQNCVGAWGAFDACQESNFQTRTYTVSTPAANGGAACPSNDGDTEVRACNPDLRMDVDCVGVWSEYGACRPNGTQIRTYSITTPAANGGAACPNSNGEVQRRNCPFDCEGEWSEYGACESGMQSRTYSISRDARNGGAQCPHNHNDRQTRVCPSIIGVTDVAWEFQEQAGLTRIGAQTRFAYPAGITGASITVAIMQGGVAAHEDIAPNLVAGYDVVDDDADASPNGGDNGLGTHLAGVVAASTLNVCDSTFCGIHGVAPDAKIMPVRFIDSGAAPTRQAYFDRRMPSAISVALDGGARILLDGYSQMIRQYHVRARYDGRWENFNFLGPDQRAYNIKAPLSAQLRRIAAEDAIFIVRAGDQGWQDAQDDGAQRSGRVSVYAGGAPQILRTRDILRPDLLSTAIDLDKDDSGWWASLPSLRNYEFLDGHFIAVMAIDDAARATTTTNGCGDAMNYCLAAPGSFINSYTSDAVVGDANRGADYGLEERSGTGQAAAHVAGAVALLMHKYPMLSAPQISSILLTSAVDLGLAGVDRVFGHGLLSLERALAPLGSLRLANAAGRSFAAEDSFINPGASPAFGGALTDARMPLGYLDSFDRVYAARFGEFVKKHDDGDAAYAALAAAEFSAASGDCAPLLAAAAARTRLLFVAGDGAACEDFPVFARPRAFFADGGNFAFVEHTEALSPAADMRLLFGGGDNLTFAAARVDKRAGKFALAAEAGGWIERRNLLGAEFSGGLKIGGKARTVYSRLAAAWSLAGWKTGASAIAAKTTAATAKDSLVTRIGDIYSLGFALNAANPRGDWEIKISRPLSVVRGALDLEFIGDYNDGGHIPASARLDLAGKPQISASLIRRRPNGAAIAVAVVRRDSALIPAAAFKVEF